MGHEPTLRGIVTGLLEKLDNREARVKPGYEDMVDAFRPTNAMADAVGWPKQWLVCPHCGEWSWRLPPHTFDPCPLVVEAAQSQGMKMDAERSMAIRAGVNFEKQAQAFQEYVDRLLENDEE